MRKRYIKMISDNSLDLNWFYDYYIENFERVKRKKGDRPPTVLPRSAFLQLFRQGLISSSEDIINLINIEYEVTSLQDKNGKYIWVV